MALFVIVAYKPQRDKKQKLLDAIKNHLPILRSQGLATNRQPYVMRTADGTIIEVFEWESAEALKRAHQNEEVLVLWNRFADASEYVNLVDLKECSQLFANSQPVDL